MLAQYKKDIMQIAAHIPVMLKDFYYNPSLDYKEKVLKKIQNTNLFLASWKGKLQNNVGEKADKSDVQFIQKFANIVNKESLENNDNNVVIQEAVHFLELLQDLEELLEKNRKA